MAEKYYNIGARTEDDFDILHEYLTTTTSGVDGVPDREVICANYTIHSPTRGTYLLSAEDTYFNGTSAACPVACGFITTVLEHNRDWVWSDVKNYIKNTIEPQTAASMTIGTEPSTATDSDWLDTRLIQGSDPIILYEGVYSNTNPNYVRRVRVNNLKMSGNISLRFKR